MDNDSPYKRYANKNFNSLKGKQVKKGYAYKRPISEKDIQVATMISQGTPVSHAKAAVGLKGSAMSRNVKDLVKFKQEQMRERFLEDSVEIYENLKGLALNARSEMVRFQASKDILDRAGLAPIDKKEINEQKFISTDSKITYDLLNRFKALELEGDKANPDITTIDADNDN